ncbi:MAG: dTDP-4-dehydrorhamnose reductase [Chloroflexi bacterium]|mgnify:CR=1 FL=1|nr:dTDP-4-dehydrorhamnose reductase [Chloroflexota bacterium]
MRIAITGSQGQLGRALQQYAAPHELLLIDLPDHDITDPQALLRSLQAFAPRVIIHTAAITDVDGCERDPNLAYRVNVLGTRNVVLAAMTCDCPLVHISTDYVFDGTKGSPYWEYDEAHPQSVYARTKWMAEEIVRNTLAHHYIARIAWLYGEGPRNFVQTVLRLARERGAMSMVTDEVGSPTNASHVAQALLRLIELPAYGTHHLVNTGICSRYEFACEILATAGVQGIEVTPTTNYVRLAQVPKHVELANHLAASYGIVMQPWQEALRDYLAAR